MNKCSFLRAHIHAHTQTPALYLQRKWSGSELMCPHTIRDLRLKMSGLLLSIGVNGLENHSNGYVMIVLT